MYVSEELLICLTLNITVAFFDTKDTWFPLVVLNPLTISNLVYGPVISTVSVGDFSGNIAISDE